MNGNGRSTGREYWRSLDQLAQSPEFLERLQREFPPNAIEPADPVSRRSFVKIMAASMALAYLTGCRRPVEEIVPYVRQPEDLVLGEPRIYATAMPLGGVAYGLLARSNEGRPTKLEPNDRHPSSRGGSSVWMQAALLDLYDPDRSRVLRHRGERREWSEFVDFYRGIYDECRAGRGAGFAVLCDCTPSPTMARLQREFTARFPRAQWVNWEPVNDGNIYAGFKAATGRALRPAYRYDRTRVIISLEADFLGTESDAVAAAWGFAAGRRVKSPADAMNRLYVVESAYSVTGAAADHRLRLQSRLTGSFAAALTLELQALGVKVPGAGALKPGAGRMFDTTWLKALARDLAANRGAGLVVAGRGQPAAVHALVFALNQALGNVGNTVTYFEGGPAAPSDPARLRELADDLNAGKVKALVILGGNPAYNTPADLDFGTAVTKAEHSINLSSHYDETSQLCEWHIPQAHFLESWGDGRAADGTPGVIQPLIQPLYGGKSVWELAGLLATGFDLRGYELVRDTWGRLLPAGNAERSWRQVLHDGLLDGSAASAVRVRVDEPAITKLLAGNPFQTDPPSEADIEAVFRPDYSLYDGRFANNGWLQELPDPVTKLMWDNAALMSPRTAKQFGLANGDLVELSLNGRRVEAPVWTVPGQADWSVTLPLGYGRELDARVAAGAGFNAYRLRSSTEADFAAHLKVIPLGKRRQLACSQDHGSMEGRPLVREGTLEEYRTNPEFAREMQEVPPLESLWKEHHYDKGHQWGMAIDLNACIGCNACVIACQSENNIPIVGRKQAGYGREMHWIRLDRYFNGDQEDPQMVTQPVACQHCEMAPCEQVCPVAATNHDAEGLNVMVYNRCVGTRYCSNNCPYKVRRFNFFNYTKKLSEPFKMAQNPDVTVRSRGVMEKCTYCLQRINRGKRAAKLEGRELRDGDIVPACQQSCPADAIVFGDINDPESRVAKMKRSGRNYGMLTEFNTRPRTSYQAKLRNPNPELG